MSGEVERELEAALDEAHRAAHAAFAEVWRASEATKRLLDGADVGAGFLVAAHAGSPSLSAGAVHGLAKVELQLRSALGLIECLTMAAATIASMKGSEALQAFREAREAGIDAGARSCGCAACDARSAAQTHGGGSQPMPHMAPGGDA